MRNHIFARFVMAFTSIFMAIETNAAELGSFGSYIPGAQMELDLGLIGYKAKKLPSGLKLDKKTGFVKGKAKKPGEYISTFTKKDDETHTAKFVIGPLRTITISMEGDIEKCKVTGATKPGKGYLVGKKVTLSAKGPKGTAFNGWFMAGKPWPNESEYLESRVRHVMTEENLSLVARFEKEKMSVLCNRLLKPIPVGREFSTPILIETQSGVKSVKGSKLPTGLKVKKDKSTGAWYIQGKPKKEGVWKSTIKVTAKSGAVEQLAINVTVNDGTSSGGNLTDANGYFTDNLQNGDGEKYSLSMDSGDVDSLLPSLALSSSSAKLDVTGLPEGLTYNSSTGKIKGKATKAGSYTVTLTVTDNGSIYLSTITIVVGAPANSCDLLVSSVTATRTTVYIGEKFNLRYVVKNGSNFDSQLFKNKISAPGGFSAIEQICGGLAKNDEVAFRAQIDSGRLGVGSHIITIQADSSNDAIEADETNNQKTITLKVVELPTTSAVVDWEFKAKAENPSAVFLSTASQSQLETFNFNKGETIYTQINFWNRLRQLVPEKITVSALLDTGVSDTWYWNGLQADMIAFIPDEHRRASKLQALPSGVYTLEILLDSNRFVNSDGLYYYEANKLNNSEIIEFTIAGDNRVVTFDANGGSLSSNTKSLIKGSMIGEMPKPTLSGYRFAGWYNAKDGGVEITSETIVAKNMTLYAKWTAEPYTVRFHVNDGRSEIYNQVLTTGVETNLQSISKIGWNVEGYEFSGWAMSADGDVKYADGVKISSIETDKENVAHLYAVWTFNVKFHKCGGFDDVKVQTHRKGKEQDLLLINEDLNWDVLGVVFKGWATSPDGEVRYSDGISSLNIKPRGVHVDLYAVWQYDVIFHKNDGSNVTNTQVHTTGRELSLLKIKYNLEWNITGYSFAGWATEPNGPVVYSDGENVIDIMSENGAVNLYAIWRGNNYTVKFHKNYGPENAGEIFAQTNAVGVAQELLGYTNFNWGVTGYRFAGWATNTTGEVVFSDGQEVEDLTMSAWGNYNLYAVWSYDVRYIKNDGTSETASDTFIVGKEKPLMDITSQLKWSVVDRVFLGWATSNVVCTTEEDYANAIEYINAQKVTDIEPYVAGGEDCVRNLYAVWRGNEYTVRFHKSKDSTITSDQKHIIDIPRALLTIEDLKWNMDGYEFAGWSTKATGEVEYTDGEEVKDLKIASGDVVDLYAVWTYKIIYHNGAAGLTNTVSQVQKYGSEQRLYLIDRDLGWSIPGATFKGWAVTEGGDVRYSDGLNSAEITPKMTEIHLYAVWEYNVKYYKNDGTSQTDNQTHTLGKSLALLKISDDLKWNNSGYYFVGWATEPNGSVVYADGQSVIDILPASGAVNLYAVWRGNNYTVKFHKNFGVGASEIFAQTNTVGVAQELLGYTNFNWGVTGYRFAGWATNTTGEVVFSDGQEVEDLTMSAWGNYNLYAVWSYDVRYIKNDGTSETASDTFIVGKEKPLMDITSQLKWSVVDRVFLGWATSNVVCMTEEDYANAIEYINAQKVTDIEPYVAGGEDCVRNLYAVWRGNEYTVRFHKSKDSTITFNQLHIIDIPRELLTIEDLKWNMDGYEFAGWSTKATGEVEYTDGEEVENLKNATGDVVDLYAVWTYKIIYHKGAGLTNTVSQVQKYGSEQRLYLIDRDLGWSIPGATFKGWAVTEGGDVRYSDGFNSAEITPKMTEIHLYPVWEYSVKYYKNDGSSQTDNQTHTLGKSLALLKISDDLKWNKNGYYFIGWATEPNGSVVYADGQSVIDILPASGVVNLYAVWCGNNYTVKFHKNFGTGASEIFAQTNTVGVAQELLGYTNFNWGVTGYRFAGWATSTTGDAIFSDGQEVEDLTMNAWGNYDLYAVWEYDVKYNKNDGTNESTNETFVVGKEQALMDINSDLNWSVVGKVFLGWATNQVDYTSTADYTDAVVYSNSVVVADIAPNPDAINQVVRELYAVWIPSYSIDFHSNDGTSRSKLLTIVGDEDAVLPSVGDDWQWEKPKNDDINGIIGWALTADATGEVYRVNYKIKDIKDIPPGQTINLYAVWENKRYAIMYHKNDGSGIIVTNTYALEEYHTLQDVNKDLDWTVNEDDYFYGWSTLPMDSTGTNTVYTNCYEVTTEFIEGVKEGKHIDLYAIWKVTNRALDVTLDQNLEFKWDGGASWFAQDAVKKNGYLAMQSGELLEGESSILQTEISGPVNVSFWWKVSALQEHGKLGVWIDDKEKNSIQGDSNGFRDWELYSFDIPEGTHTIKWVYTQMGEPNPGNILIGPTLNCGWVDGLTITPISGGSDIPTATANTAKYAMRSVGVNTSTVLDSSRITGQFVDDSTLFELLVDDVNAAITSGKLTEYCEEGVITFECDVERVEEGLVLTQDNRIILIKISNGVATAEIIMD